MKTSRLMLVVSALFVLPSLSHSETVAELIAHLEAVKPELEVVVQVDRNLVRSVAGVDVVAAAPVGLPEPRKAAYYEPIAGTPAAMRVAVLGATAPAARATRPASSSSCETACDPAHLALVDVSCDPPGGGGPDGRTWVHLVCGQDAAPLPYDWQLARLDGHQGDIFAWNADPTYAYVEGQNGSYQAAAYTALGELTLNVTLPATCGHK